MNTISKSPSGIIQPWQAFLAPTEQVSIETADGRIAASTIRQYPPGIPEVIPGMAYSNQILSSLQNAHKAGVEIIGIDLASSRTLDVTIEETITKSPYLIETFDSRQVPAELISDIADFFRLEFSKGPYFHFAFHESDPLQSLPHTLDFDAYTVSVSLSDEDKRETCQNTLREFAIQKARKEEALNDLDKIILPKGFHRWTDKNICREKIKNRLSDPGYVTLVKCTKTQALKGLLHSRMGTLERLFQTEEWSDPLLFSTYDEPSLRANPDVFFEKAKYHFGLSPNDEVMTISAQILTQDTQGGDLFYDMMRSMAQSVMPNHANLPLLCEIPPYGTAHTLNRAFTNRIVFGLLKNTHPVVFSQKTSQALFPFVHNKAHWHAALRKAVQDKRHYRKKFFIPQKSDHPDVSVKPNGKLGLAVFATQNIKKGSRIAIFTGETYRSPTALDVPEIMRDHVIQIGPSEFLFGYKGLAHCICHSCDPNCGIRNFTEIHAVKDIAKGEQISWDYRCSENSNWVLDNCLCGSERCTGTVRNYDSLPASFKREYKSNNMVSEWIVQSEIISKRS